MDKDVRIDMLIEMAELAENDPGIAHFLVSRFEQADPANPTNLEEVYLFRAYFRHQIHDDKKALADINSAVQMAEERKGEEPFYYRLRSAIHKGMGNVLESVRDGCRADAIDLPFRVEEMKKELLAKYGISGQK